MIGIGTINSEELIEKLWQEGVDASYGVDTDQERVFIQTSLYGTCLRILNVWGEPDEFFLDIGDIELYERSDEGFCFLTTCEDTTAEGLTETLLKIFHERA